MCYGQQTKLSFIRYAKPTKPLSLRQLSKPRKHHGDRFPDTGDRVCGNIFTVYLPFVLGSLAIIFAILSKGYGKKMLGTAKAGIGISIAGIILVSAMISALVGVILSSSRDTLIRFGQQVDQQLELQTGLDPEDILGTSYEEIMREYADLLNK